MEGVIDGRWPGRRRLGRSCRLCRAEDWGPQSAFPWGGCGSGQSAALKVPGGGRACRFALDPAPRRPPAVSICGIWRTWRCGQGAVGHALRDSSSNLPLSGYLLSTYYMPDSAQAWGPTRG